jgi:hypothetical protein
MKRLTIIKENNAGGVSLEFYQNDKIHSVVTGLEFGGKIKLSDVISYNERWDWTDVGGDTCGYSIDGNTDGSEYRAANMMDDHETTSVIAEYDGVDLSIYNIERNADIFDFDV